MVVLFVVGQNEEMIALVVPVVSFVVVVVLVVYVVVGTADGR